MDDRDDVQLYGCQKMAGAVVYGITGQRVQAVEGPADQEAVASEAETDVGNTKQLYRVQVGAYTVKGNADFMLARLKACGFDAVVVNASQLYRVQVGAYSVKDNAVAMQERLKAAGFDAVIVNA